MYSPNTVIKLVQGPYSCSFWPLAPLFPSKGAKVIFKNTQAHAHWKSVPRPIPIVHSLSGEKCTLWTTTMTASKPARIFVSPFTDPPRMLITAQKGREGGRKWTLSWPFRCSWHRCHRLVGWRQEIQLEREWQLKTCRWMEKEEMLIGIRKDGPWLLFLRPAIEDGEIQEGSEEERKRLNNKWKNSN